MSPQSDSLSTHVLGSLSSGQWFTLWNGEQGRAPGLGHSLQVPRRLGYHGAPPSPPGHVLFSAREQRVTGTIVFILTGISVFLAPILQVRLCTLCKGPVRLKVLA